MEVLRNLYVAIKLADEVTAPLKQINESVNKFKDSIKSATKPIKELTDKYLYMSATFDQSLAKSKYFFEQMDLATKEAIIRAKQLPKPIQDIAIAFENVKAKVREFADAVRSKFSKITEYIESHKLAIAGLGATLSGIGLGGLKIFGESAKDFERAVLEMKARTHMTNKEFDKMVYTLKQLAKANSDSFKTISEVLTIVRQRFGDLGDETRTVAQAILDFAKITGSDAVNAANALSVTMKAFNIPATKMYEVTDILIAAQQRFGVNAVRLAELLYYNGAAMRKLGLTFNETVAILAAMESKGVNISRALLGLRSAIDEIGGTDNFRKVLRELASIQDKSERTRRALEIFGSYAGPGIATILDEGLDGLDKYLLKLEEVRGTTLKASATIDESLSEQLGILRNNLNLLKVELGTALLPVLKSVVRIVKSFAEAVQSLPAPIKGVLATLTALITIISAVVGPILMQIAAISWLGLNYMTLKTQILGAARALRTFAVSAVSALAPLLPYIAIAGVVAGAILLLQDVLVKGWEKSYLGRFINWLSEKLPFLKPVVEGVGNAINWLRQGFDWLVKSVGGAIHWIQQAIDRMGPLKYILLGPVSSVILLIRNIDRLRSATSSALTAIKSLWDRTIGWIITKIDEFITKIKQAWEFITKSPIGKITGLITGGVKTVVEYLTMKTTEEKTIHLVETKKKKELLRRNVTEEEIRKKAIEQYEYVKSLKIQGITNEDEIKRRLKVEFGEIIVNPQIIPYVGKPEYDRKFYEEGSIKLKIQKPVFKPEIEKPALPKLSVPELTIKPKVEKPELSWLEQLYLRVKPLFEMTRIPELTGIVRYVPDVVRPEVKNLVAGITYIPKLVKPEITHELTRIMPTPSQLVSATTSQPVSNISISISSPINFDKVEIRSDEDIKKLAKEIERKQEEIAEKTLRKVIAKEFASHGVY